MKRSSKFLSLAVLLFVLIASLSCRPQGGRSPNAPATPTPVHAPTRLTTQPSPLATPTPMMTTTPPLPEPTLTFVPVPAAILAGEKIAFVKDNNLQLINVASRAQFQVTTSGNVTHIFGWSHDGSQLLLGIGERPVLAETDMPGGTDLWVLDIKDGRTIQLTRGLGVQNAAWSPTNNEIAYTMLNDGLYLVKSDGARLRKVADKALYDLAWSPQGAKIAFILPPSTWTGGLLREYDIAVLNVDDKSITQLTSNAWTNYHPVWSSDGQKILFESDREHSPNTGLWYIMNADGSSLRHLGKPALLSSMNVTKSPIANQVAFEVSNEIWVMDFDGSVLRVTEGSEPYWSPDGNRLAYVGKDNGMWVINVDGTNAQSLFNSGRQLHWSK